MPFALFSRAQAHASNIAVIDGTGRYTYQQVTEKSDEVASLLQKQRLNRGNCIAFQVTPGLDYIVTLWAIWKSGHVAVPLGLGHPTEALRHTLTDSQAQLVMVEEDRKEQMGSLARETGISMITTGQLTSHDTEDGFAPDSEDPAIILYTSGTTNQPKGVVLTFENIEAQVLSLTEAWQWSGEDHILNVLPLHHVHGIINICLCALWSGATLEFYPKFDATGVLKRLSEGEINLFMAVPTIYFKLIQAYEELPTPEQVQVSTALKEFRLMVSGSAALPVPVLQQWKTISGHTLLERYGMTEIGMGLSNPYDGERRPGHVGQPLPGVQIRLVAENGKEAASGEPGEIQVRARQVFKDYWNNRPATEAAFDGDWFRTGDMALLQDGYYKILGRTSVDILKSGGYKISALEIEDVLLSHPDVLECAVVGLPDDEWGELIAAAMVLSSPLQTDDLIQWMKDKLPAYKIPRILREVSSLPRNAMGKVSKKQVVQNLAN